MSNTSFLISVELITCNIILFRLLYLPMICIPLSPRGIEQVILNTTTQTILRDAQNQFLGLVFTATTPPVVE